ncbi:hypothetical protein [Spirillospora sp. NPDC047279]|uniref:hypothetical protein n=1 Tax=Spirillospora sp. NPDC047279 TaxID=3155478 RepID=UPI0033FDFC4C
MSDSEPQDGTARFRADRRLRRGAVAAALALVVAVTVGVVLSRRSGPGGISDGPLVAARGGPHAVPAGRIFTKPPRNCGVSDATAARLAPGADRDAEKGNVFRQGGPGSCMWYSLDDGKEECDFCTGDFRNERVLNVDISLAEGRQQSPISEAMRSVSVTRPGAATGSLPPKIVEGLGEEAIARYSAETDTEGATVSFREGNAVVTVRYKGWDAVGGDRRTISEKTAVDGVLAVAAETARSMGAAARPALSAVKHPVTPPLRQIPKPCDAVPDGTVDKVARGAYRRRGGATLFPGAYLGGMSVDGCTWNARTSRYSNKGQERKLTVSFAVAEERLPGLGVFTATRQYQGMHLDLRDGKTPGIDKLEGFRPLAGPGDRAFAVTKVEKSSSSNDVGVVLFQKRNVLVEVAYSGDDEDTELSGSRLIDSAYTVAVAVERSLRS